MYAIIQTGGKQYKVEVGDEVLVEKLDAEMSKLAESLDDVETLYDVEATELSK